MEFRLPYYMAYPMPLEYDDYRNQKRDLEYMKSMYPESAKRILPYVEEECERMEYQGSMIYDEYPDKLQVRMLCRRIWNKVRENEEEEEAVWDLIQMMVFYEIYRHRCEHREYRKRYY